jgi:hypothetical protein
MVNFKIVNNKDENTLLRHTERIHPGEAQQNDASDDYHDPFVTNAGSGVCRHIRPEKRQYFSGR